MCILLRKHFFLFKEESEVLWAGKNATASHAGSCRAGVGGVPSCQGSSSGDLGVSGSWLLCGATESRGGMAPWLRAALPLRLFAELALVQPVPRKRVWGSGGLPSDYFRGHAGVSQTGWSHCACHLYYLSGHST